jgi:HD-GYP domain-containing protein (c-di-GMP phosphodiesterase class II)
MVEERTRSLATTEKRLRQNMLDTVTAVSAMVEMRDPYTAGHQHNVAKIATAIARELNLPISKIEGINLACVVHDVGKIKIPAEILSHPGRLNEAEYGLIKMHAEAGYDILKGIDFPWPIALAVRQHHERMDGTGYPAGIKGEGIILEARILAVADVIEAMAAHRPYRASLGIEAALSEIEANRGTHYDPVVADAALALFREKGFQFEEGSPLESGT